MCACTCTTTCACACATTCACACTCMCMHMYVWGRNVEAVGSGALSHGASLAGNQRGRRIRRGSRGARVGKGLQRASRGPSTAYSRTCKRKEAGGARWEVEEAGRRRRGGRVSCGGVGCEAVRAPAGVDIARKRIFKTSRQPLFSFDSKPRAHACRTAPRAAPPEPSRPRCGSSAPTATKKRKEIHGIAAAAVTAAASSSTPAAFQPTPRSSLAAAGSTGPLRGLGSRVHPCPR